VSRSSCCKDIRIPVRLTYPDAFRFANVVLFSYFRSSQPHRRRLRYRQWRHACAYLEVCHIPSHYRFKLLTWQTDSIGIPDLRTVKIRQSRTKLDLHGLFLSTIHRVGKWVVGKTGKGGNGDSYHVVLIGFVLVWRNQAVTGVFITLIPNFPYYSECLWCSILNVAASMHRHVCECVLWIQSTYTICPTNNQSSGDAASPTTQAMLRYLRQGDQSR
jgi:hypothetical protein